MKNSPNLCRMNLIQRRLLKYEFAEFWREITNCFQKIRKLLFLRRAAAAPSILTSRQYTQTISGLKIDNNSR